jgi:hypothetical protein
MILAVTQCNLKKKCEPVAVITPHKNPNITLQNERNEPIHMLNRYWLLLDQERSANIWASFMKYYHMQFIFSTQIVVYIVINIGIDPRETTVKIINHQ